jgi:hypothetical protein
LTQHWATQPIAPVKTAPDRRRRFLRTFTKPAVLREHPTIETFGGMLDDVDLQGAEPRSVLRAGGGKI